MKWKLTMQFQNPLMLLAFSNLLVHSRNGQSQHRMVCKIGTTKLFEWNLKLIAQFFFGCNSIDNFFWISEKKKKSYMYIPMMESSSWYLLFANAITFSSWFTSALIIELLALSLIEELVLISSTPMVSFLSLVTVASFWYDSTISSLDPLLQKNKEFYNQIFLYYFLSHYENYYIFLITEVELSQPVKMHQQ